MIIVNIHEAKSSLSKLVKAVENGEIVRITRNGKPVVELCAIEKIKDPLIQNPRLKGTVLEDPSLPTEPEGW